MDAGEYVNGHHKEIVVVFVLKRKVYVLRSRSKVRQQKDTNPWELSNYIIINYVSSGQGK